MSSGSKHTIVSLTILASAVLFTAGAAMVRRDRAVPQPPHIIILPPPAAPSEAAAADTHVLRVCADPNNLPFSNDRLQGFENRLAELVAADMGRKVAYYWDPQRRGFIRNTLRAHRCDVVMGVPSHYDLTRDTAPYYRSSYVFVSKRSLGLRVRSLDDPILRRLRIGVQITGDDYENPPAAQALADRHIIDNVRGYTVYGDYSSPHPSWGVLDALDRGEVDVAIVWGPLAGYFASRARARVLLTPVTSAVEVRQLPFTFEISMGVRHDDKALADRLNDIIKRRAADIHRILDSYGVPVVAPRKEARG